jgi:hypothetical protein
MIRTRMSAHNPGRRELAAMGGSTTRVTFGGEALASALSWVTTTTTTARQGYPVPAHPPTEKRLRDKPQGGSKREAGMNLRDVRGPVEFDRLVC